MSIAGTMRMKNPWPNGQDISPATIRLEMAPCGRPQGIELKTANAPASIKTALSS